nr:LacI family DNA-binding transcriptional regulator [Microtetraspora sp. NBRC 13810]
METVAMRAGTSRATVSRVINGESSVSRELRAAVLQAVDELGYVPNSAARSLATRRSDTVALVLAEAGRPGDELLSVVVRQVGEVLQAAGVRLTLMLADSAASHRHIATEAEARHVDGILLVPGRHTDPLMERLARTGVPIATLGRHAMPSLTPYVGVDNAAGAALATRHLLDRGRRRVAMICGPMDLLAVRDRLAGYRDTLAAAGHRPLLAAGDFSRRSGEEAAARLLTDDPGVDAVFAAGDQMAIGALRGLRAAGRRVPDDVALAGFDDIEAASWTTPALTTVHNPVAEQAAALARLLVSRLEGRHTTSVLLPPRLVVRESS